MDLEIDFSCVEDLNSLHELLMEVFGFPDFYGKNVNALIDCLTSIRYPEDGMTTIVLKKEDTLNITVRSFPMDDELVLNNFLIAIQSVNQRYDTKGMIIPIRLVFI